MSENPAFSVSIRNSDFTVREERENQKEILYVHSFSLFIYLKVTRAISLCFGAGCMFLVSSVVIKSFTLLFIILFGNDLFFNVN